MAENQNASEPAKAAAAYPETMRLDEATPTNVLIYEYGARVDRDCEALFHEQAFKAHTSWTSIGAIANRRH